MGSWLEAGPGDGSVPGSRLGLPGSGPGSVARPGRRGLALVIDWLACLLISAALFPAAGGAVFSLVRGDPVATLAIFAVENVLLVGTIGHTLGHRVLNLRVRTAPAALSAPTAVEAAETRTSDPGRPPGLLRAAVRTALLLLVVPAVVQDADGRGLHDRLAGTLIVRR